MRISEYKNMCKTSNDIILEKNKIYDMLNVFRFVSAILVICIHTVPLKNINSESGKYHPYINVFCADKNDINAFAGKVDEDYYMGILKGVFLNLKKHIKDFIEAEEFELIPEIGKCNPEAILNSLMGNILDFFTFH